MSQQTADKTTPKSILCKTFTEQNISALIDPQWLLAILQANGITYQVQSPMGLQARAILVEDIKCFLSNYYKQQGIDITTDETVAKQINTFFESSIVKTNPYAAVQSGAISQERIQEIVSSVFGFGGMFNPMMGGMFGGQQQQQMGGMFGGQMGGMGGMFGGQMGGMFGGFNQGMPMWNKKSDQKPQQPQFGGNMFGNPMMMGGMFGNGFNFNV